MPLRPNTIALYDFENDFLDDSGNGYTLTSTVAPPFSTTNGVVNGTYSVGPILAGHSLTSSVGSAMKTTSGWTIEGSITFTDIAAGQLPIVIGSLLGANTTLFLNAGGLDIWMDNIQRFVGPAASVGVKYYFALVSTAANTLEYWFGEWGGDITLRTTLTDGVTERVGTWPNSNTVGLGYPPWSPAAINFTGYYDWFRISDVARTVFPTADAPTTTITLSQYNIYQS